MDDQKIDVPPYFLCPISLQIMKDPVTVSTGITYDRDSIERWISTTNKKTTCTCPVTKQIIMITDTHDFLTPNHTLRRLIQSWCTLNASYGIERFPTPKPPVTKTQVLKLINEASNHPQTRPTCLNTLKSFSFQSNANKRSLEAFGVVEFLFQLIIEDCTVRNEALSVLSLLKITENQLKKVVQVNNEDETVIIHALAQATQQATNYETKVNAIELMNSTLMQMAEPAKAVSVLRREHFKKLVELLGDPVVSPKVVKSTLKLLSLACQWGRNRVRVAEAGVVSAIIDILVNADNRRVDEIALVVVELVCGCAEGRAKLLEHGCGLAAVGRKILRVSHFGTEHGVRIIGLISRFTASADVVAEMAEVGIVTKLCLVLQVDCGDKTRERVKEILKSHARAWRNSSCAPIYALASF